MIPIQSPPIQRYVSTKSIAMSSQVTPSTCNDCMTLAQCAGNSYVQAFNACKLAGECNDSDFTRPRR
jgi:hypothetical protein